MANLFKNELALILGVLCAKHFKGRIYRYSPPGKPQGGGQGYNPVYIPSLYFLNENGTGRGGYYKDEKGDFGKPGYGDETFPAAEPSLAGQGGGLTYGGSGLEDGQLLYGGGTANGTLNISAGGGAGWYGGGSAMVSGGGGGGSSFVLSELGLSLLSVNERALIEQDERWQKYICEWIDHGHLGLLNSEVSSHPWLYDLNTYANDELEKYEEALGDNYSTWVDFRRQVNNNGCVLVSNADSMIRFSKDTGWTGLNEIYTYDPDVKEIEWTAPSFGYYHFICYGACGGNVSMAIYDTRGGYGGVASGRLLLNEGDKLYFVIGQQGQKRARANYGGGAGRGGSTGGGGCTFIKYLPSTSVAHDLVLHSRIIVAGGGGGIADFGGNAENLTEETVIRVEQQGTFPPNEEKDEPIDNETIIPDMKFWVNDLSTVHVLVKCYNQQDIPDFAKMNCSIYINDGMEGELHQSIKPGGGVYVKEFQFKLNTLYTPNTPTHEVSIQANIKTNFFSILAQNGIVVWVTTEDRLTDGYVPKNNIKIKNNIDTIEISDICDMELHRKGDINIEYKDEIDIEDYILVDKVSKGGNDNYLEDETEIEDGLELKLVHLSYININEEDEIENEDFVDVDIKGPVYIQIVVDESTPYGSVDESSYIIYNKEKIFTAYPNEDYLVEWYLDDILISTENSITVKALEDKTYIVKFIATEDPDDPDVPTTNTYNFADLDYVQDGINIAYDLIYNTKEGHKDTLFALQDLAYDKFIVDTEYVPQTESDIRFDGILNSEDGHATSLTEWSDIAGLV